MLDNRRKHLDLVKVIFELEVGAWHGSVSETLAAERVDQRRFRLRNVPFFAFGVSFEDIVFAKNKEEVFEFERVALRGGHSTYRIFAQVDAATKLFQEGWQQLEGLGCTYEQGSGTLRALDVPPKSDIREVYRVLEEGEREGIWSFEEGHCGHPLSD